MKNVLLVLALISPVFAISQFANEANISFSLNTDGDSMPNIIDPDDDNDGVLDNLDAFPLDNTKSTPTTATTTLTVTADASCRNNGANGGKNYGAEPTTDLNSAAVRYQILKFSKPALSNLVSAILTINTNTENDTLQVFLQANSSWLEGTGNGTASNGTTQGVTFTGNNSNFTSKKYLGTMAAPVAGKYSFAIPLSELPTGADSFTLIVLDPTGDGSLETIYTKETSGKAATVALTYNTAITPRLVVTQVSNDTTYMAGSPFSVGFKLAQAPTDTVYIPLLLSDSTRAAIVGGNVLMFTPANWNTTQTKTLTPSSPGVFDITIRPLHSKDTFYNGFNNDDLKNYFIQASDITNLSGWTVATGSVFSLTLNTTSAVGSTSNKFKIISGPVGMGVVENSGKINFKPLTYQIGTWPVTIEVTDDKGNKSLFKTSITVTNGGVADPAGKYVVPYAATNGTGTAASPFNNIPDALASLHNVGGNVYVRGGNYELLDIQWIGSKGTVSNPIVIQPAPGETVKFDFGTKSNAFEFLDTSRYIEFKGFEIDGGTDNVDFWCLPAQAFWGNESIYRGGGIAIGVNGQNITIRGNYIHNCYQKAIEIRTARYLKVYDNIIHSIATTSLSGGHGIMRQQASGPITTADTGTTPRWDLMGNLIFNVEQRIYSWVPSKGYIDMVLDEGKPILIDDASDDSAILYTMKAKIQNNVVAYGSIDNIRLKSTPNLTVSNNTVYTAAPSADGITDKVGDAANRRFTNTKIQNNAVQTMSGTTSFDLVDIINQCNYAGNVAASITGNYAAVGNILPSGIIGSGVTATTNSLFVDPNNGNFRVKPALSLPATLGVPAAILDSIDTRVAKFAVNVKWDRWDNDHLKLTQTILDNIPGVNDGITGNETVFTNSGVVNAAKDEIEFNVIPGTAWKTKTGAPALEHFELNPDYTAWLIARNDSTKNSSGGNYTRIRWGNSVIKQNQLFQNGWLTNSQIYKLDSNTVITGLDNTLTLDGDLLIDFQGYTPAIGNSWLLMKAKTITTANSGGKLFDSVKFEGATLTPSQYSLSVINIAGGQALEFKMLGSTKTTAINATICSNGSYFFKGANRTTAGVYVDSLKTSSNIDSIVTLTLTVNSTSSSSRSVSICAGQSYVYNGQARTAAGIYKDTFVNTKNCDSVETLTLIVNSLIQDTIKASICPGQSISFNGINRTTAGIYLDTISGGTNCDTLKVLNLTMKTTSSSSRSVSICSGQSYMYNGLARTTAGTYKDTFVGSNGCDSIETLVLSIKSGSASSRTVSICSGQSYMYNGAARTIAGIYKDTFIGSNGCDSIETLTLIMNLSSSSSRSISICAGQSYVYNGQTLTTAGTYLDTFVNSKGCDSIETLTLTIRPVIATAKTISICTGQSYMYNGVLRTTAGTYKDTFTSSGGCDSIETLTLSITPALTSSKTIIICAGQSYMYNGVTRTTSGSYMDTFTSSGGCDSIETLTLNVLTALTSSKSITICQGQSYMYNGVARTIAGAYKDTFVSSRGCDSIETLTLNVSSALTSSRLASICTGQSYMYNGSARTTAGSYMDTFTSIGGCDSIETLTLTVLPTISAARTHSICSGNSYVYNGQTLTVGGTYKDTFVSSGGCDSIETLTLIVNPTVSTSISVSICQGKTYFYNGQTLTAGGTYKDTFMSIGGCDSIETLTLTVNPALTSTKSASICQGSSYIYNGIARTIAGTYFDTFVSSSGCDSIESFTLVVLSDYRTNRSVSICPGSNYFYNGQTITSAGSYKDTFVSIGGCDSIETLTINLTTVLVSSKSVSICQGGSYFYNGAVRTMAGSYLDTFVSSRGCDSIETLTIILRPVVVSTRSQTVCQSAGYLYNGTRRTISGTYMDTFTSSGGCDSVETLTLTVIPTTMSSKSISICSGTSYFYNGRNITVSGTYKDTFVNSLGCDSIETLILTVNSGSNTSFSKSICFGSSYLWNGIFQSTSGVYADTFSTIFGCDSIVFLNLTVHTAPKFSTTYKSICSGSSTVWNGMTITNSGAYKDTFNSKSGCDSIVTLILSISPPITGYVFQSICLGDSILFNSNYIKTGGSYPDTFTSASGCDSVFTMHLSVHPRPIISISPNGGQLTATFGYTNYVWQLGSTILKDSSYIISPSTSGVYSVKIEDNNRCTNTATFTFVSASIDNVNSKRIVLYPNPVSDKLYISHYSSLKFKYKIFNQVGQSVIEGTTSSMAPIDVSILNQGTYLVQVEDLLYKVIKK